MNADGQRYFRWRDAIRRPIWCIDRHWYALLGRLYPAPKPSVMDVFTRVARRELTPEEGARLLHK